jgi:hypothetical protein
MPSRLKLRHAVFTAGIGLLLAYQNCAQAPNDTDTDLNSSYQTSLPFAFKAQVDTLAYMSCLDMSDAVEKRAYFTFRLGAYRNTVAGLSLTDDFRTATQYYTTTDRALAFAQSDHNAGARLTLSIRDRGNYQSLWSTSTTLPQYELDSFLPPLEGEEIAGPLAATTKGQFVNYFPGSSDKRLIEASLRFYKSKGDMDNTRATLEGNGLLAVAYAASADELDTALRGPGDFDEGATSTAKYVYGSGYQVSFSLANNIAGQPFQNGERRVLTSVSEKNLETGVSNGSSIWDCANRFMIVRPEDAVGRCNTGVDRYANATQQKQLEAIRRVLRVEDWFVDMTHLCVVPKRTGDYCYGKNLGTRTIQYSAVTCVDNGTQACPHYVSVCIRN